MSGVKMYLEKTYEIENTDYILVSCNSQIQTR